MNRSMLVASCLALGWAPWATTGVKAQNAKVVRQVERLITHAAAKDQPPPAAPAQGDAAAKEAELKGVRLYMDASRRLTPAGVDSVRLSDTLTLLEAADPRGMAIDFAFPLTRQPGNSLLGATLNPVEESVRAQLSLSAGQGLVVSTVSEGGPCALVGLRPHDIIIALGDKPIGKSEDLNKALLELGAKTGQLRVLRGGKQIEIQVKPVPLVTLGVPANEPSDYFIGVSIEGIDEVLQKALQLPEGKGVTITEVIADSPAEKAGFKKYDLITQIDGKVVDNAEHLRAIVQKAKTQAVKIGLIRSGTPQSITVTPVLRKQEVGKNVEEQKDSYQLRYSTPLAATTTFTDKDAANVYASRTNQALTALLTEKYKVDLAEKEKLVLQTRLEEIKRESQVRAEKLELEIRALKTAIDALNDKIKSQKK